MTRFAPIITMILIIAALVLAYKKMYTAAWVLMIVEIVVLVMAYRNRPS